MNYNDLTPAQAKEEYAKTLAEFEAIKAKGLKLNMARGKPSKQQLDQLRRAVRPALREEILRGRSRLQAGAGVRRRQRQPDADV